MEILYEWKIFYGIKLKLMWLKKKLLVMGIIHLPELFQNSSATDTSKRDYKWERVNFSINDFKIRLLQNATTSGKGLTSL